MKQPRPGAAFYAGQVADWFAEQTGTYSLEGVPIGQNAYNQIAGTGYTSPNSAVFSLRLICYPPTLSATKDIASPKRIYRS